MPSSAKERSLGGDNEPFLGRFHAMTGGSGLNNQTDGAARYERRNCTKKKRTLQVDCCIFFGESGTTMPTRIDGNMQKESPLAEWH